MSSEDPQAGSGYTHHEMRLIFERAGMSEATRDNPRPYTLADIEAIGVEAGLDVADIRRAAASIRDVPTAHRLLGAPTRYHASHFLEEPLGEDRLADVVEALRRYARLHGELRFVPDGVEWHARPALGAIIVHFSPRRKGTRVSVLVAREDAAVAVALLGCGIGFVVGTLAGVSTAIGSNGSAVLGLAAFVAGTVAGAYTSMRLIWQRASRRAAAITKSLLDTIVTTTEATIDDAPG